MHVAALAQLSREALANSRFVSLTFPAAIPAPDDHEIYQHHVRVFNQDLARKWGASGIWQLGFQQRGAAHFRLLVFGLGETDFVALRDWVSAKRYKIVGSGDEKHLRAGTEVDKPRSVGGVLATRGAHDAWRTAVVSHLFSMTCSLQINTFLGVNMNYLQFSAV